MTEPMSPEQVAALIAERDALRQQMELLEAAGDPVKIAAVRSIVDTMTRLVRLERDDARAECARLRAELEAKS